MTTGTIRYGDAAVLNLGVDGTIASGVIDPDGCCNDPFCTGATVAEAQIATACGVLDLLPSGPMWDRQKIEVREALVANGGFPDGTADIFPCPSMAVYAAYLAQVKYDYIHEILGVTVRESQEHTAVDELDDWLERYNWIDCFRNNCTGTYISMFSPYRSAGASGCGSYCATNFPADFECALKHAILQSLKRLRRGVIKNLDGINWVIEPLGAELTTPAAYPTEVQDWLDNGCPSDCGPDNDCPPCWCDQVQLELKENVTELPGCPTADSFCDRTLPPPVPAVQDYTCADDLVPVTIQIYPGVVAAECIIRSMLGRNCPNIILRQDP